MIRRRLFKFSKGCYLTLFKAWKRMNIAAKETSKEVHNRQEGIGSAYLVKL